MMHESHMHDCESSLVCIYKTLVIYYIVKHFVYEKAVKDNSSDNAPAVSSHTCGR